jgi:Ca2+-binding RTX toxin-like protein
MAFINGNSGNNVLKGTTDADDIYGLAGDDTLNPGVGSDTVYLRNNPNNLGAYDDFLDGGVGNDLLVLDYSVNSSSGGVYEVYMYDDEFVVAENGETEGNFVLHDNDSYDYIFCDFKNINRFQIIGNSGDDSIDLPHAAGNNTVTTNAGYDSINLQYATGNNTLSAGIGDDEIELQYASGNNIVTTDTGYDYINLDYTSGNNTVTAGTDNDYLRLRFASGSNTVNADAGDDDIDLRNATGNNIVNAGSGDDSLDGGLGNDILNGGAGNDTMNGGAGNDSYVIDVITDTITEAVGAGIDTVLSPITYTLGNNLETLILTNIGGGINGNGNALNNKLVGNTAVNQLSGSLGNDTLIGNAGNDVLTGGSGSDQFLYDTNKVFVGSELGVDRIADFVNGTDKIVLDKTTFTTLTNIASDFAVVGSDAAVAAEDALIVYSSETSSLFYNQNGVAAGFGSGAQFATLSGITTLSASDFILQT